jgi:hypothetical protein
MGGRDPLLDRQIEEQRADAITMTSSLWWLVRLLSRKLVFSAIFFGGCSSEDGNKRHFIAFNRDNMTN